MPQRHVLSLLQCLRRDGQSATTAAALSSFHVRPPATGEACRLISADDPGQLCKIRLYTQLGLSCSDVEHMVLVRWISISQIWPGCGERHAEAETHAGWGEREIQGFAQLPLDRKSTR